MKENSTYKEIDPSKIHVIDGFNQRVDFGDIDELAAQIKEQGLLEAISVIPFKTPEGDEEYLLVNGERRYRAIRKLIEDGETVGYVKAELLSDKIGNDQLFVQQFMRNEAKKFNDVELGRICQKLLSIAGEDGKPKYNRADVAKMLGKNPGVITYALQSLNYDPQIREMMENGEICGSDVRRVYTAARKKYGDEWEQKGNEELLKLREKANEGSKETDAPAKVSIKENDLYGDVKDTKLFTQAIKLLITYISHYEKLAGDEIEIDIMDMYDKLRTNEKLTLRELFENAVRATKANAV